MSTVPAGDGALIGYEAMGSGPPLVLVHGITESRRSWDPLLAPLARDHRVIAVDLRGHGESERRPPYDALTLTGGLQPVMDAEGVESPILVGHSLGGSIVAMFASFSPVRAVVDIDQPLLFSGFKDALTSVEPMLRRDQETFRALMYQLTDMWFGPLGAGERARIAAHSSPDQDVVLGVWDTVLQTDVDQLDELMTETSRSITAPFLSLHGTDPGEEYTSWLRSTLPNATYELWPDHGHYPHLLDQPRFLQRLREFEQTL